MNEKTFNKVFNAFLLTGMIICVTVACILNLQKPDARVALTILSAVGAIMGVISVVLSANGNILTFVFGLVDVLIYSYTLLDQNVPMTNYGLCIAYVHGILKRSLSVFPDLAEKV